MKLLRVISVLILFMSLVTIVQSQEIIFIAGNKFHVELNNQTMTAKITDYHHEIDDAEFPMMIKTRKFKRIENGVLQIPKTVDVHGRTYTITSIGRAAFADYKNFKYVNIPETVETIEEYAFFRTPLVEVRIPFSVLSIGNRAFGRCKDLKYINLPQDVAMGESVYLESLENIIVKTENVNVAPKIKQKGNENMNPKVTVVQSDIDMNIPTTSTETENTFAIIIANENYQNDVAVDYALQDGRTFYQYCLQTLGLPKENIRFQEDATLNNIRGMVSWVNNVAKVYKGKAQILVYYAGHGVPDENENNATYLLPVDGSASNIAATGYSLQSLYSTLGALSAQSVCVFLDACFSGTQRNNNMILAERGVRKAKEENPMGKMVVFSASTEAQTAHAYPEKGHGMFTYYLIKKIKETQGNVTFGELADYVCEKVSKRSVVVLDKLQTPTISASATMKSVWRNLKLK